MEFKVARKQLEHVHQYPTDDVRLAGKFAKLLQKELGDFLMGVVLFGSSARRQATHKSDIDILIVTDDSGFQITEALVQTYRIIVEKLIRETSPKLHVTSMLYTAFWDYAKAGDPVVVNMLRDGVALYDIGFFEPLQRLLKLGKVRPSEEAVWKYFGRAPKTLLNSRWHVLQGTLDLYWAVIDAAHAALMRKDQIPPTPEHVADLLEKVFVKKKHLEAKYVTTMRKFYLLSKKITHREVQSISGQEYEKYYIEADDFVKRMKKLVDYGKL